MRCGEVAKIECVEALRAKYLGSSHSHNSEDGFCGETNKDLTQLLIS